MKKEYTWVCQKCRLTFKSKALAIKHAKNHVFVESRFTEDCAQGLKTSNLKIHEEHKNQGSYGVRYRYDYENPHYGNVKGKIYQSFGTEFDPVSLKVGMARIVKDMAKTKTALTATFWVVRYQTAESKEGN